MKKRKLVFFVIALMLIGIGIGAYKSWTETVKQKQQKIRAQWMDEKWSKIDCMYGIGASFEAIEYQKLDDDENLEENTIFWEAFVDNPYTEKRIQWLNQYMEAKKILDANIPYDAFTVEQLKKEYEEIDSMLKGVVVELYGASEINDIEELGRSAYYAGCDRETIELLGYPELAKNFTYDSNYYDEVFLQTVDLQKMLKNFNQYVHENYSDSVEQAVVPFYLDTPYLNEELATLCEKNLENRELTWKDFTLETVQDSENVYNWLIELKNREEEKGGSWEAVVQACRVM